MVQQRAPSKKERPKGQVLNKDIPTQEEREANKTQIFTRPQGTPESRNINITNLSPEERKKIQLASATEGLARQGISQDQLEAQAQERIAQEAAAAEGLGTPQFLTPEQSAQKAQAQQLQKSSLLEVAGKVTKGEGPLQEATSTPLQQATNPTQLLTDSQAGLLGGAVVGAGALAVGGALLPSFATVSSSVGANTLSVSKLLKTTLGAFVGAGTIGGLIKVNQRQKVTEAATIASTAQTNMASIIEGVKAGTTSRFDAVRMFNEELDNFYSSERALHDLTNNQLESFLSGGGEELAKIESFKRVNLIQYQTALQQAILQQSAQNLNTLGTTQNSI